MILTTVLMISLGAGFVHFIATYILRNYPFGRLLPLELSFFGVLAFIVSQLYVDYSLNQASLFFLLGIICIAGFVGSLLAISTLTWRKK